MTTWKINLVRTISGIEYDTSDKPAVASTFSNNTDGIFITSQSGEYKEFIPMQRIEYIEYKKEEI